MRFPSTSDDLGKEKEMKKYTTPELEMLELDKNDIITTSPGTETTPKDDFDGIWDLDLG